MGVLTPSGKSLNYNMASRRWSTILLSRRRYTLLSAAVATVFLLQIVVIIITHLQQLKFRQRLPPPTDGSEQLPFCFGSCQTVLHAASTGSWPDLLAALQRSVKQRYVVVHVQYGLGNRLRALASAMAVAAATERPLVVIWPRDAHCNCSFRALFDESRFAVLELDGGGLDAQRMVWNAVLTDSASFVATSYMREDGVEKDSDRAWLPPLVDANKHLFVKTAYRLAHPRAEWSFAAWQLHSLTPRPEIARLLIATSDMVGVHVRSVVDAGAPYGTTPATTQREWRRKGSWPSFVDRMAREPRETLFYLAADSQEAYDGLEAAFPGRTMRTARACPAARGAGCEARDAASIRAALVDMLNLARTQRILGSGFSSFSEVARFYGSTRALWGLGRLGPAVEHYVPPLEVAGIDFAAAA